MKLLYVEDEKLVRESVSKQIRMKFPVEVFTACHGEEGMELFKKVYPEIVLTDIRMPVCDGLEMTRQIRELSQDTYIVIISAYADFDYAKSAMQYQVYDFVIKPITMKKIEETVCELIKAVKVRKAELERRKEEELVGMLHGFLPVNLFFKNRLILLAGYKALDYQKGEVQEPLSRKSVMEKVRNIISELLSVGCWNVQFYMMQDSYNGFCLFFHLDFIHSLMHRIQVEREIKAICREVQGKLKDILTSKIVYESTSLMEGKDMHSGYLSMHRLMDCDAASSQMLMYMGNKKFEEEKKLYMLLKEERYSDAWLELETLFLNNKEINQKENIILRLSYYFYIAMNEEYSEMNISYMDFYKEFPEIRTGMSEKELAGKVLDALKKTAQIQKRKEEGQVHPVIYSIKKLLV